MIYYSHVNEDNRIERNLMQQAGCPVAVAIAGSGERVLSLMDIKSCKKIMVVDCNEHAIYLLQLKLTALSFLPVKEYLQFIGHYPSSPQERTTLFETIKNKMPQEAKQYWNRHKLEVAAGILHNGHFEKFLHRLRPLTNFYLGNNFQRLFREGYRKEIFPSRRWRLLKKLFSYKLAYQLAGNKDIAFVGSNAAVTRIPVALDNIIKENKAASSFMAHLVFKGHLLQMQPQDLPPSLQEEILLAIKRRLMNQDISIEYHKVDLLEYIDANREALNGPVFYSLSDILSFADNGYLQQLMERTAVHKSIIVARSFLRNRLSPKQLDNLRSYGQVKTYDEEESTNMYQVFSVQAN